MENIVFFFVIAKNIDKF